MSDRPQACHPPSLITDERVGVHDSAGRHERDWQRPAQPRERGARALGAQLGQWRWRSGREVWPHRK